MARIELQFRLLLGLLMMITRRNAVSQVVGFMSLENGLILAATGAKGPGPLVSALTTKFVGKLRIPITLVPGNLSIEEIDTIA